MKSIDPVESALIVVGIDAVLSREVEKVKLSDVKEMEGMTKFVYAEAKRIVNGEKASVPLTAIPYKKMLGLLTEKFDAGQLEAMVAAFPPALHEITGPFLLKANEVVNELRTLFPMATKETLLGPENIMPSALAIRKFGVLYDVINDPRHVLAHIACGSLLTAQVTVIEQFYPTFSACVTDALQEAGTNAKAAKKSFRLPPKVEIGYGKWAGIPQVNPRLATRLQKNFSSGDKEKTPAGSEGSATSVAAKEAMTSTQRANFPTAIRG